MPVFTPSYIMSYETGELSRRAATLTALLKECVICPWNCRVDRTAPMLHRGVCRVGRSAMVANFSPHFFEEPPLTGYGGSGAIFLSYCNLKCVFCQNYDISHFGAGLEVSSEELSKMMVMLQRQGCHNVNFVAPTHQIAQIIESLPNAIENGLSVPLVYNCGGYESVETIKLLDGIFDIYMPDFKYGDNEASLEYSGAKDYVERARESLKEMHRQVGDLVLDKNGIAERGLMIRHLVLPCGVAGTREVMRFIAKEISKDTYVNVMGQYRPCHRAFEYPPLDRRVTEEEVEEAVRIAKKEGLHRFAGIIE